MATFWDNVERAVKLLGIISGAAALIGVYVTVSDFNEKAKAKELDEWQRSVIYNIVQQYPGVKFGDLSVRYGRAAQGVGMQIPKDIDDQHLQLAVLSLIQSNSIILYDDNGYYVKKEPDLTKTLSIQGNAYLDLMRRQMEDGQRAAEKDNDHMALIADTIRINAGRLTEADLRGRIERNSEVDKVFIQANFSRLLEVMLENGRLSEDSDGNLYFGRQMH